jgi:hypothetical protein
VSGLRAAGLAAWLLVTPAVAGAHDPERSAMSTVRLTTEATATTQCARLGLVRDNSVKDLRKKIVQVGGDTGLVSFPPDELSMIYAQVYRCTASSAPAVNPAARPVSPPPPPPPPGPPPPPPAGTPPAPPR